ncbi:MAG: hypothetical protein Q4E09_05210 [Eubacteriales bacterium]|nr:hypothetical protein [Eubacteriales bacterium]
MKKNLCTLILVMFILSLFLPAQVFAENSEILSDINSSTKFDKIVKESINQFDLYLPANKESVVKNITLVNGYTISFSLYAEEDNDERLLSSTSKKRKLTSKCEIKNTFGIVIATLKAVGEFDTDGVLSKPLQANGTSSVNGVKNIENVFGPNRYNSWVRISFAGTLPTGIYSINFKCTIYCDADGNNSSSWE